MKVLRGGYASRHEASFVVSRPYGQKNYVVLLLRSKGEYWINGLHYLLDPGYAVIIAPNTHYFYHNPNGNYADDWLHFQLEEGDSISDYLECNVPFMLNDFEICSTLIRQLLWEHAYTSTLYVRKNINALFSVLLNHLSVAFHSQKTIENEGPYEQKFRLLRFQMQNTLSDKHSIQKHAAEFGLSSSRFQHLYSQQFKISFQNDLIQMRIAYAEFLLKTTDLSIEHIADACGYTSIVHFYRQFKQIESTTPAKYRSQNIRKHISDK